MILFRELDKFNKNEKNIPIWFMRQAGRYLKEYREIKEKVSFMQLCYDPILASEVTLQPIKRFDFDAAIIFSDILVLCDALGFKVEFKESIGPIVSNCFQNLFDADLTGIDLNKLNLVYDAIRLTRANLDKSKSLIGFCGAPWTLASYIIEGGSSKDFVKMKKFIYQRKVEFDYLIELFKNAVFMHLEGQINAGCDVVQLFDSHSGHASEFEYFDYIVKPAFEIFYQLKQKYPHIKIIWFPRNSAGNFLIFKDHEIFKLIDGLSVDYSSSLKFLDSILDKGVVFQGNLDPMVLAFGNDSQLKTSIDFIINSMSEQRNYIFNLGHGVYKETPVENVKYALSYIRKIR